ncbi:amidase [Devosia sp. CN2-171]|uniref:amidase n=1 Tax=Devosia sp. CN2-171 TaxID=3400909 RepID=UPI003BF7F2E1
MLDTSNIPFMALTDVAAGIKSGALSPVTLTETMLARIAQVDTELHSFLNVTSEAALVQARRAETEIRSGRYRGPLHGVPIAIKDLFFTRGVPATFGSLAYKDFVSDYSATVVDRLEAAGAIILGRLALHEGALAEHHPHFGAPPRHPYVAGYWPGGSSSGSGVATAAGLCFASLGSDTGGSIRFPSATNGLTGLKPTWGRVSRYGVFTLADTLDSVGPMCRSAADAAAVFDVIAGHDMNDPTSLKAPVPGYLDALEGIWGARDLRIGVDWNYIADEVDPELVQAIREALAVFESIGGRVVPIRLPKLDAVVRSQRLIMETECARYHEAYYRANPEGFGKLAEVIERGFTHRAVDVAAAYIEKDRFRGVLAEIFEQVDVIPAPIMPWVGMKYDELDKLFERIPLFGRFGGVYNMAGVPTITFPVGINQIGLPLAMQLIGTHLSEATLFRAAHAYQQATDWHLRRPTLS